MNRKERKLRAKQKRMEIQQTAFELITNVFDSTKDWSKALDAGNMYFTELIRKAPQEKALILEAGQELDRKRAKACREMEIKPKSDLVNQGEG